MPETITADNLQGIRHGFFKSEWGNCGLAENYNQAEVAANRAKVAEALGVPASNLLSCYQIHSPDVITVTEIWLVPDRPKADAMVTSVRGIALGILTADCVPVLFADKAAGVIGGAHAGWRGAVTGVIENTISAMEKLGASRKSIHAAIGPCIAQNSYEVGPEFPALFWPRMMRTSVSSVLPLKAITICLTCLAMWRRNCTSWAWFRLRLHPPTPAPMKYGFSVTAGQLCRKPNGVAHSFPRLC